MENLALICEFMAALIVVVFSAVALHNELKRMENEDILSQSLLSHIKIVK